MHFAINILAIRTESPAQTVHAQVRLLNQDQFNQVLYCLAHCSCVEKSKSSISRIVTVIILCVPFSNFYGI